VIRNWIAAPRPRRSHLLADVWIELKRYAAQRVTNIELAQVRGIDRVRVEGPVRLHSPLVLTALAVLLECDVVFEFGSDTGGVAQLLARNLPDATIYLLDEGADATHARRRLALRDVARAEPGEAREPPGDPGQIRLLAGDSAAFDFVPYSGTVDLAYIEGAGRTAHLASDTEAAFGLLSELGTIVWDGYSGDAGVYAYLNDLAPSLDRPIFHLLGTRLALYSRWDIVVDSV
jgi:hypothetical protein